MEEQNFDYLQIAQSAQGTMRDIHVIKYKTLLVKSNSDNRWRVTRRKIGNTKDNMYGQRTYPLTRIRDSSHFCFLILGSPHIICKPKGIK